MILNDKRQARKAPFTNIKINNSDDNDDDDSNKIQAEKEGEVL